MTRRGTKICAAARKGPRSLSGMVAQSSTGAAWAFADSGQRGPQNNFNTETSLSMKKIALSGAAGQLGTVLRAALVQRGMTLRSAGGPDPRDPLTPLAANEEVMHGDLVDPSVVDALLEGTDVLIHLAG